MGFNNDGARQASFNITRARKAIDSLPAGKRPIVGVNIGKTKVVAASDAVADYVASTRELAALADYLVINVSSPNTPGLRDLQSVAALEPIITAVRDTAAEVVAAPRSTLGHVPLLVKIAPDLSDDDVVDICDLAARAGADGLIVTNTTIDRSVLTGAEAAFAKREAGGISGRLWPNGRSRCSGWSRPRSAISSRSSRSAASATDATSPLVSPPAPTSSRSTRR